MHDKAGLFGREDTKNEVADPNKKKSFVLTQRCYLVTYLVSLSDDDKPSHTHNLSGLTR